MSLVGGEGGEGGEDFSWKNPHHRFLSPFCLLSACRLPANQVGDNQVDLK